MSGSVFSSALGTNFIPADEEVVAIKHLISEPLSQIAKLDDEISAAEDHVKNLCRRREVLLDDISGYRQLISPVRRLPSDVLREVFISSLPDDRNPTMSVDDIPVILTRISSHWRDIALTTPQLWAALHIPVPNSSPVFSGSYDHKSGARLTPDEVTDIRIEAVREWIKRSGTLPLHFSVHEYDGYPPSELCRKLLHVILPYRTRWRSIKFVGLTTSFVDIHHIPPSELPMLDALSLTLYRTETARSSMAPWKDMPILQAPVIRNISLTGIMLEISELPFIWSQLTELTVVSDMWSTTGAVTVDETVEALKKCPNLVTCKLDIQANTPPRTEFPIISLVHLESLTLYDGARNPDLYRALDLPKLRKLDYMASRPSRQNQAPATSALLQLLRTVTGSMQELALTSGTFENTDAILSCLAQCHSLTSLSIVSSYRVSPIANDLAIFIDGFLEQFVQTSIAGRPICSKLEVLRCIGDVYFSDEALLDFILRKQGGTDNGLSPLKLVEVQFTRQPTINIPEILEKRNMTVGLKLELEYPPRGYRGPFSLYEGISYTTKPNPYRQPH